MSQCDSSKISQIVLHCVQSLLNNRKRNNFPCHVHKHSTGECVVFRKPVDGFNFRSNTSLSIEEPTEWQYLKHNARRLNNTKKNIHTRASFGLYKHIGDHTTSTSTSTGISVLTFQATINNIFPIYLSLQFSCTFYFNNTVATNNALTTPTVALKAESPSPSSTVGSSVGIGVGAKLQVKSMQSVLNVESNVANASIASGYVFKAEPKQQITSHTLSFTLHVSSYTVWYKPPQDVLM